MYHEIRWVIQFVIGTEIVMEKQLATYIHPNWQILMNSEFAIIDLIHEWSNFNSVIWGVVQLNSCTSANKKTEKKDDINNVW